MRRSKEEKNQMRMQCIPEQLCRLTVLADMLRASACALPKPLLPDVLLNTNTYPGGTFFSCLLTSA